MDREPFYVAELDATVLVLMRDAKTRKIVGASFPEESDPETAWMNYERFLEQKESDAKKLWSHTGHKGGFEID